MRTTVVNSAALKHSICDYRKQEDTDRRWAYSYSVTCRCCVAANCPLTFLWSRILNGDITDDTAQLLSLTCIYADFARRRNHKKWLGQPSVCPAPYQLLVVKQFCCLPTERGQRRRDLAVFKSFRCFTMDRGLYKKWHGNANVDTNHFTWKWCVKFRRLHVGVVSVRILMQTLLGLQKHKKSACGRVSQWGTANDNQ